MSEPVQQSPRQPLGSECFGPFVERQVAGDQRGAAFVAAAEDLEQQFGPGLGKRHETQLVNEQQFETRASSESALGAVRPWLRSAHAPATPRW